MRYIEPHGHMVSRTTDDYQAMVTAGCAAVCEPAFWAGFDRGSVSGFRDYYRQLTEYEPARAAKFLLPHFSWLCLNPKEAEDLALARDVLALIPEFLQRPNVLGIGEIGLNRNTRNEMKVLEQHVQLAVDHDQLILVHTPHLEDKLKGTRLILDVLSSHRRVQPDRVIIDHVEEHTIQRVLDRGFWAGITLYPDSKSSPPRAVDMLELCGRERIWLNSACDWGVSDPLAVPKTALEMRRRGHSDDFVDAVLYRNPHRFLSQCPKFRLGDQYRAVAMQLAKILEVRVEDLFQLEHDAPTVPARVPVDLISNQAVARKGQPVQLCRVGKRTVAVSALPQPLLPVADGVIVENATRGRPAEVQVFQTDREDAKRLLVAGCDPGVSLLAQHLGRFNDVDIVMAPCSSQQALEWLKEGKVHVAGSHLRDLSSGEYNLPAIKRLFPQGAVKVVTFAVWEQGFVVAAGNPKNIRAADDLARKNVRVMNREKGAGSRELLDRLLQQAGIAADQLNGYERIAYGHLPAALAVSIGDADCCIATRSAARAFGLGFVPLATERYDLVLRRQFSKLPAVEALLDTLNRAAIRRKLETLAGYDTRHTGEVLVG